MTVIRVGADVVRAAFSPDLLEEIRIMAEAGQARWTERLPSAPRAGQSFLTRLSRVLGGAVCR